MSNESPNLTDHHIVAVIDARPEAETALQELRQAGYVDPLLLTGEEGAQQIDAKNENSHLLGRILGAVQDHLSEATNYLRQYEEEARNGNYVVAVEAPDRDAADRAQHVLERNGGRNIRFFGALAVSDLTPQTNPSFRSDESPEPQRDT